LGRCGKDLRLGRGVVFYNPSEIIIGNNVYVAYGNWFSANASIVLSDEVVIGPKNVFASGNHTKLKGSFRYGKPDSSPIKVGKGSWIGANCTITAGVKIGAGSVIGANTVVTKNVPDNVLFAGNPGKIIKEI
jgi:maltose O-acetyltransferase